MSSTDENRSPYTHRTRIEIKKKTLGTGPILGPNYNLGGGLVHCMGPRLNSGP